MLEHSILADPTSRLRRRVCRLFRQQDLCHICWRAFFVVSREIFLVKHVYFSCFSLLRSSRRRKWDYRDSVGGNVGQAWRLTTGRWLNLIICRESVVLRTVSGHQGPELATHHWGVSESKPTECCRTRVGVFNHLQYTRSKVDAWLDYRDEMKIATLMAHYSFVRQTHTCNCPPPRPPTSLHWLDIIQTKRRSCTYQLIPEPIIFRLEDKNALLEPKCITYMPALHSITSPKQLSTPQ